MCIPSSRGPMPSPSSFLHWRLHLLQPPGTSPSAPPSRKPARPPLLGPSPLFGSRAARVQACDCSWRARACAPSTSAWVRLAGDAGSAVPRIDWRWQPGRALLDLHGGLALGWLAVRGAGFSENRSSLSFWPAVTAGIRLSGWVTDRFAAWLDLGALYWTRSEVVYGSPATREQEIQRLEGLASIGLAWGRIQAAR